MEWDGGISRRKVREKSDGKTMSKQVEGRNGCKEDWRKEGDG